MTDSGRPEQGYRRPEVPDPSRWSAPDDMASEHEVSDFLGALVRLLHPRVVVECGSYLGHTAAAIGWALQEERRGHLYTVEIDSQLSAKAARFTDHLPVTAVCGNAATFEPPALVDLLYVDTDIEGRVQEVRHFHRFASPACVVVVHDTANLFSPNVEQMVWGLEALKDEDVIRSWVYLPTPRGLAIGRYA